VNAVRRDRVLTTADRLVVLAQAPEPTADDRGDAINGALIPEAAATEPPAIGHPM
jgi:hypothetical protein